MNPHYPAVATRAGRRCEYCRAPESAFNFPFELDHVIPVSRGGLDDESNLALACHSCNAYKSNRRDARDPSTGVVVRLFDPRTDRRSEHFRADVETGEIIGLTGVGRATVDRLELNHPYQLAARAVWGRLRLFP